MSVLARKLNRAKWEASADLAPGAIPADAVTVDLRTSGNTLSFWKLGSTDEAELRAAVLALAAAAERADKMDVAWLSIEVIGAAGVEVRPTDGDTPVQSLRSRHVDLARLDLSRLGRVAEAVAQALRAGHHRRFTKAEVIDIVADGVRRELVLLTDLHDKLRPDVERALAKAPR